MYKRQSDNNVDYANLSESNQELMKKLQVMLDEMFSKQNARLKVI